MTEAVLIMADAGEDAAWAVARVAGLPVVERHLMGLRSAGVDRVRLACGPAELPVIARHLEQRIGDPRLPAFTLALVGVGVEPSPRESACIVLDGRRVYHPELVRQWLQSAATSSREPAPAETDAAASWEAAPAGSAPPTLPSLPSRGSPVAPPLYSEDVTTPEGRRRARRAIRRSLRKPTDGWFARTIDRSVSLAISGVLAPFPVHPNAVTVGTLLVGAASGWLASRGTYAGYVGGGALFLLASVLDGVDGELARMKFQGSNLGQWLDTVCDDLTNALYLAGLTVGSVRELGWPVLLWSGVTAIVLDVVTVAFLYWQLVTTLNARTLLAFEETILAPALKQRGLAGFVARLQPFIKRDIYAPLFLLFALAGVAWLALPATAVALAITFAFLLRDFAGARRDRRERLPAA